MVRGNGKSDVDSPELDAEHELPAAEDSREQEDGTAGGVAPVARGGELDKLKAERDTLVDRLARLQAEFENARKRTAREQQEFREYALTDAVKELLPTLDSFERALQSKWEDGKGAWDWSSPDMPFQLKAGIDIQPPMPQVQETSAHRRIPA